MSGMFLSCKNLKNLELGDFNTSNVTDMSKMFWLDYELNNINTSTFNTAKVQNMSNMFTDCYSLKTLDLSGFDTSSLINMNEMFMGCEALKRIDIGSFDLAHLTTATNAFADSTYHIIGTEEIQSPKNVNIDITLHKEFYSKNGNKYTVLPKENNTSMLLKDTIYTVNWDANGGSGGVMTSSYVLKGLSINALECTYTKESYSFKNWNTKPDGTGINYAIGSKIAPTSDITLYAQWKLIGKKSVTFDANGGIGTMSAIEMNPGDAYIIPSCLFEYDGGAFTSWNTKPDGSGTTYPVNTEITVNDDLILYAQWRVSVKRIVLEPASATVDVTEELDINAHVIPDEAYDKEIVWTSSNENIASIDEYGHVSALQAGETDIIATAKTDHSVFAICKLLVSEPDSIDFSDIDTDSGILRFDTVKGPYYEIDYINSTLRFCSDSNGSLISSNVSDDTLTVTVTGDEYPGKHTYVFDLSLGKDIITDQEIDTKNGTVMFDTMRGPLFIVDYMNKELKECSDPNGKLIECSITGDILTVTVTSDEYPGNHSYDFDLGSSWQIRLTDISIPDTAEVEMGASTTIPVTYTPANATNKNVRWCISDEKIATIINGVLTGVSVGTTKITATSEDGNHLAECIVTVKSSKPTPSDPTPVEPNEKYYKINICTGVTASKDGSTVYSAKTGDIISIRYNGASSAKVFSEWVLRGATPKDKTAMETSFVMASSDVSINYKWTIDEKSKNETIPDADNTSVKKLSFEKKSITMQPDMEEKNPAIPTYNGSEPEVKYMTSNSNVVCVTPSGNFIAVAQGTASVTAFCGNKKAVCKVNVKSYTKDIAILVNTKENITDTEYNMDSGTQSYFNVTFVPADTTDSLSVIWKSSNKKAVTVNNGLITAKEVKQKTSSNITATVNYTNPDTGKTLKLTKTVKVTVNPVIVPGNKAGDKACTLLLKKSSVKLLRNVSGKDTYILGITLSPKKSVNISDKVVSYTSTNPNILKVEEASETTLDSKGKGQSKVKLTALGNGTAYVLVTSTDKNDSSKMNIKKCKVIITNPAESILIADDSAGLLSGSVGSQTITMRVGTYDTLTACVIPTDSTDSGKIKWSANGGITVKNGMIYAKTITKSSKPAKVTVKCGKIKTTVSIVITK